MRPILASRWHSPMEYVVCGLCGRDIALHLATGSRFGIQTSVVVCSMCGFVYQNPRMMAEGLDRFYRETYRALYSNSPKEPPANLLKDQIAQGSAILQMCSRLIPQGSLVLDVGCGPGGTLLPFRDSGYSVLGIEPGAYGHWGARHLGLDIRIGTLETVDLSKLHPDLIILSFVLEHVPSPKATLLHVWSILKPAGVVFLEVPNLRRLRGPVKEYFHVAHLNFFTPSTLSAFLALTGYQPIIQRAGREYSIKAVATKSLDMDPNDRGGPLKADDANAIQELVWRHARLIRLEYAVRHAAWPVMRIGYHFLTRLAGSRVAQSSTHLIRRMWFRVRYGG